MSNSGFRLEFARRRARRAPASLRTALVRLLRASLAKETAFFALPADERAGRDGSGKFADGALAGAPDLVFIHGGRAFGLELKAHGDQLSDEERAAQVVLRNAGMRVEVARDLNEALVRLREMGIPLKQGIHSGQAA
jgi:hypothetical protein